MAPNKKLKVGKQSDVVTPERLNNYLNSLAFFLLKNYIKKEKNLGGNHGKS